MYAAMNGHSDPKPPSADVVERLTRQPAAETGALVLGIDLGVVHRDPVAVQLVLGEPGELAISQHLVPGLGRVVTNVDVHAPSMTKLSSAADTWFRSFVVLPAGLRPGESRVQGLLRLSSSRSSRMRRSGHASADARAGARIRVLKPDGLVLRPAADSGGLDGGN
jgi:hypothetical protein